MSRLIWASARSSSRLISAVRTAAGQPKRVEHAHGEPVSLAPLARHLAFTATAVAVSTVLLGFLAPMARASTRTRTHRPVSVLLEIGSGYAGPHGSALVRAAQRRLAQVGDPPGPVDGRYGPLTAQAVKRFQAAHGLAVDGITGPLTLSALRNQALYPGAGYASGGSAPVRALQRQLAAAHLYRGAIDGLYGPLTERAVSRLQAAHRQPANGIAGPDVIAAFNHQPSPGQARIRPSKRTPARGHAAPKPRPRQSPTRPATGTAAPRPSSGVGGGGGLSAVSVPVALVVVLLCLPLPLLIWRRRRLSGAPRTIGASGTPITLRHETASGMIPPRLGDTREESEAAYRQADELGDPEGAFKLGVLLQTRGDLAGAEDAYRRADHRGHTRGPSNLGVLLEGAGDIRGAEAAYRRADERGDSLGAFNLGVLLEEQRRHQGAKAAYRRAWDRGHAEAAANLGVLLEESGDELGAEAAYRDADAMGDPHGAFNLGVLLEARGDLHGAEAAYGRSEQRGAPAVSRTARSALLALQARRTGVRAAGAANAERPPISSG